VDGRVGRVLGGLGTGLVVFVAVPVVLIVAVGVPLPHDSAGQSGRALVDVLALVAWVAWAACCWPILRDVVGRVRRRDGNVSVDARWRDKVSARIAGALLVVLPLGLLGGAAVAGAAAATAAASVSAPAATSPSGPAPTPAGAPTSAPAAPPTYLVAPGDSLWSIAEHLYGDGADWQELAALNLGHLMDDGRRFTDPSLILPGWRLALPDDGSTAAATPAAAPGAAPTQPASPAPVGPAVPSAAGASTESASDTTVPAPALGSPTRAPLRSESLGGLAGPVVPELAALGIGVLAAALAARRIRRARRIAAAGRRRGLSTPPPTDEEAELDTDLEPFACAPLVDWLEAADRHLGWALADESDPLPAVLALQVGPDGVEAWLSGPVDWAPRRWSLARDGHRWLLEAATDLDELARETEGHQPRLPALAVVGANSEGTWALPLEPGSCTPVIGEGADDCVRSMVTSLGGWSWSEQVHVTEDPFEAERLCALFGWKDDQLERARVVFVGDPGRLSTTTLSRCAVLTTAPVAAGAVTVAVASGAATLEPLGVVLAPDLLSPGTAQRIDDVVASGASMIESPTGPAVPDERELLGGLSAGPVEIRLLTAVPRVEGLAAPLDPKRARRAVELVAYLALHAPEPVTSDRLRSRVLGTAETDAAAKTLFNTAGAARKALGQDADGVAFLPAASKAGQYRIDCRISVDVVRAKSLFAAAAHQESPETAMALGRAALELIEGEPLSTVLSGYAWWRAEGHEARLAALVVDGACALAEVAAGAGNFVLARWALEQARLVDPYSEALTRSAMTLAALAEDPDRLRREWNECLRRTDELDPGGYPSEQTEQLFGELSRRADAAAG